MKKLFYLLFSTFFIGCTDIYWIEEISNCIEIDKQYYLISDSTNNWELTKLITNEFNDTVFTRRSRVGIDKYYHTLDTLSFIFRRKGKVKIETLTKDSEGYWNYVRRNHELNMDTLKFIKPEGEGRCGMAASISSF